MNANECKRCGGVGQIISFSTWIGNTSQRCPDCKGALANTLGRHQMITRIPYSSVVGTGFMRDGKLFVIIPPQATREITEAIADKIEPVLHESYSDPTTEAEQMQRPLEATARQH